MDMNRQDFFKELDHNNSILIVFVTGSKCIPCERAKPMVQEKMKTVSYKLIQLDRDRDADIYSALRCKKQVKGVPTLLAYEAGNYTIRADISVSGANPNDIDNFFQQLAYL
jgi:thiol-disulfide isomerase/thioredoxin